MKEFILTTWFRTSRAVPISTNCKLYAPITFVVPSAPNAIIENMWTVLTWYSNYVVYLLNFRFFVDSMTIWSRIAISKDSMSESQRRCTTGAIWSESVLFSSKFSNLYEVRMITIIDVVYFIFDHLCADHPCMMRLGWCLHKSFLVSVNKPLNTLKWDRF